MGQSGSISFIDAYSLCYDVILYWESLNNTTNTIGDQFAKIFPSISCKKSYLAPFMLHCHYKKNQ